LWHLLLITGRVKRRRLDEVVARGVDVRLGRSTEVAVWLDPKAPAGQNGELGRLIEPLDVDHHRQPRPQISS
jgi:hypothetical protein